MFLLVLYSKFSFFFLLAILLSCMFFFLGYLLLKSEVNKVNKSSLTVYECSYTEMNSMNNFYTMLFFVVALSFMLFDLEIILLLPYMYIFFYSSFSLIYVSIFFFILMISLLFEMHNNVFNA